MVADRHRLAAYHNKHCWRAFRGYQHRWPWTTLNPKNIMGLKRFFCYFRLRHTLRVNVRWNILEIDQYNLRMKLNWCCGARRKLRPPTPLGSRSPPYECIKFGYPLQNARFLLLSSNLARKKLQIDTDLLRIIISTVNELSGVTNIDDLEQDWTPK